MNNVSVSGVVGTSDSNVGVFGMSNRQVGVFGHSPGGTGVLGDASGTQGVAVFGNATGSQGIGVQGEALAAGARAGMFRGNVEITRTLTVGNPQVLGPLGAKAGIFRGDVEIAQALTVNGTVTATVKNAIVPFPDGTTRVLHCMESPEHWFEDFGSARLKRGRAVVKLDADFAKTIKARDYRVFLTPEGDCGGLYIRNRGNATFEVREVQGGTSSVAFSYRIVGRRKDIRKHLRFAKFISEPLALAPETRTRSPVNSLLVKVRKRVAAKPARAGRRNTARVTQRLSTLLARVRKEARANSARNRKRGKLA